MDDNNIIFIRGSFMNTSQIELLNGIYKPLREYATQIIKYLKINDYRYKWGYYSGHYIRNNQEWILEEFPIPVITIEAVCEIGIDLSHIFMEGKLTREQAIKFDFSVLKDYKFEVYGIKDYLNDFYNENTELEGINDRIFSSSEDEIGVSLFVSHQEPIETIFSAINTLRRLGFYS